MKPKQFGLDFVADIYNIGSKGPEFIVLHLSREWCKLYIHGSNHEMNLWLSNGDCMPHAVH